jgi:hypothetical protein
MCIWLVVSLSDSRNHHHLLRFVVATSCRQSLYGATHHTAAHELLMGPKHAFIATRCLQQKSSSGATAGKISGVSCSCCNQCSAVQLLQSVPAESC